MNFAKGIKTETDPLKQESVNKIEDTSNTETKDRDTPIHADLRDIKFSIDIDFCTRESLHNEITQTYK